jgi:serine phosphatase RsbU (regulator of sigma subunit)
MAGTAGTIAMSSTTPGSRLVRPAPVRSRRPHATSVIVLGGAVLVFGALSWLSYAANQHNNHRLLRLQTKEAASVLGSVLPTIETPLSSVAELAEATNGDSQQFKSFIAPDVGKGKVFGSVSLWSLKGGNPVVVSVVGSAPALTSSATATALFARAARTPALSVAGIAGGKEPVLGYALVPPGRNHDFAVYAETNLPRDRLAPIQRSSAFSDLSYALYLGRSTQPGSLLEASTLQLPLTGHTATTHVPFGDSELTFVAASTHELGGALSADSWWLIAILGAAVALGAGFMSERLVRRRHSAEQFAREVEQLYAQQRDVAETLQHSLLSDKLPEMSGIEMRARYVPGVEGLEIGGDWYDVVNLDESRLLFVVGDVSGRGLRAATIMASLRYAIRAYAMQGDAPATIFAKLGKLVDIRSDRHFATVLCGLADIKNNEATFVSAGHPPILLQDDNGAVFLPTPVGPPIGVRGSHGYISTTVMVPAGATLLAFTDGLIERRGEHLDVGFCRLRDVVATSGSGRSLDALLDDIISALTPRGPSDDVALLGLRWNL